MTERTLVLSFPSRAALEAEVEANLRFGRAFVKGVVDATSYTLFSQITLALSHPEHQSVLEIACEVVMVLETGPHSGVALQFSASSKEASLEALVGFIAAQDEDEPLLPLPSLDDGTDQDGADQDAEDLTRLEGPHAPSPRHEGRFDHLRNLSAQARSKVAHGPSLEERVQLERMYGPAVWENLLRNPKITIPEVASMARKGTLPRPLLELICDNEHWIRQAPVRRALLANPRLSTDGATKVLRCLPPRELKLVPQQTAYPASVRTIAQRLLRNQ